MTVTVEMYHAEWCGYCRGIMGDIITLQKQHRGQGVDIRIMPSATPPPGGFKSQEGFPTFVFRKGDRSVRFSGANLARFKSTLSEFMNARVDHDAFKNIMLR